MSLQLLNKLAGNTRGRFRQFIDRFNQGIEPNILWYPSAGEDFRSILYLSPQYGKLNPGELRDPACPNLYLYTDYLPVSDHSPFLDKPLLYTDMQTGVRISGSNGKLEIEELPRLNLPLHEELALGIESSALNRVVFMNLEVYSAKLGALQVPLLYIFSENTTFFKDVLLKENARISHVVHIRYGGSVGGMGTASGVWILKALRRLKTKVLITDNDYYWQSGDEFALNFLPELKGEPEPKLQPYRTIDGIKWSNNGDVTWNLVE